MGFTASVTWRERRRRLRNGTVVRQPRYVVSYRCPNTRRRTQRFFSTHKAAIAERDRLIASVANQAYAPSPCDMTVGEAMTRWLEHRKTMLKSRTRSAYKSATGYIVPHCLSALRESARLSRRLASVRPKRSFYLL